MTDGPHSTTYFDPMRGYVTPEDDYVSDTYGSLKDVLTTLKNLEKAGTTAPDDFYTAVERVLYRYNIFIQHGVREDFGKQHKGVSWYLVELVDGRDVITYQDGVGHEWCDLCLADEVPLWLLIGLLHRIKSRKKLGDQRSDEIIEGVYKLDADYVSDQEARELNANRERLNVMRRSRLGGA
jgi:hypothetical protein